jgi:hypothetical protein
MDGKQLLSGPTCRLGGDELDLRRCLIGSPHPTVDVLGSVADLLLRHGIFNAALRRKPCTSARSRECEPSREQKLGIGASAVVMPASTVFPTAATPVEREPEPPREQNPRQRCTRTNHRIRHLPLLGQAPTRTAFSKTPELADEIVTTPWLCQSRCQSTSHH